MAKTDKTIDLSVFEEDTADDSDSFQGIVNDLFSYISKETRGRIVSDINAWVGIASAARMWKEVVDEAMEKASVSDEGQLPYYS
jgi:hypothetical protein